MEKVRIKKINNYDYTLIDNSNKEYIKNIEFTGKYKPHEGDIIYLSEKILIENNLFSFGDIYDQYNVEIDDIIKVVNNEKEYFFQRQFG